MAANQKPEGDIFIEEFVSTYRKKTPMTLLEFNLPTLAVLKIVPMLGQLGIKFELEKRTKEDLILIEVEREKSMKIYWLEVLCDTLYACYSGTYCGYKIFESKIKEVLQQLSNA